MSSGTITTITTIKYAGYTSSILVFQFLGIPQMEIAILGILMIFDFATGVGKQFRLNRQDITSHNAWLGVMKKVGTIILLFSIGLVFRAMHLEPDGYVQTVLSILIMAEFYSIVQNIYTMRTGKIIPEFDAISILLKMIGEFVKGWLEKTLSNKKK